jgi:two-component system sensor histidine kinase RpfC
MAEPSFIQVASQLNNDRVQRVLASLREPRVALVRLIVLVVTVPYLFAQSHAAHPMIAEGGRAGLMGLAVWLPICGAWWIYVRRRAGEASLRLDLIGVVLDALVAFSLLRIAFIPNIFFNAFWPLIIARMSALFPRRWFVIGSVISFALMLAAAPGNYWLERPAYFLYGTIVNIVLPLTLDRMFVALRSVATQAVASQQSQLRFIGAMSHELRTPLNAVLNGTALIEAERLDPDQRELFGLVRTNADTLLERVNSVLDVAAIGAGKMSVVPGPTSMAEVLRAVFAACLPAAAEAGVSLHDERRGETDALVLADAGRVNQVLINLVGNAIKFTLPGGRVTLETGVQREAGRVRVTCRVIDTGKGVADSEKATIFNAFHQAADTTQTSRGGVGLGLHIARSLTELMQGHLSVGDNPGGGAIFTWGATLPLAPAGSRVPTATDVAALIDAHRAGRQPLTLLVIDDQEPNRRILERMLQRAGHGVTAVATVDEGLRRMHQAQFDAVLLDLYLPGRSGFDFLEVMRQEPQVRGVTALVVVSADTQPEVIAEVTARGAEAFLRKPISPAALFEVLTAIAGRKLRASGAMRHAAGPQASIAP